MTVSGAGGGGGGLGLAFRLARRELRGGLRGFYIFLACLALGVGAIATVQSVSSGILEGLREDGRAILGGDILVRNLYRPIGPEAKGWLADRADAVSAGAEMRAMARNAADDSALVEFKAVDGLYPLFGAMELRDGGTLEAALARIDGRWGAVAEDTLLDRLGLAVGDQLQVGQATFDIRAAIEREPDRAAGGGFSLGPRLMVSLDALPDTGLLQPGSMVTYEYRVRLPSGDAAGAVTEALETAFPERNWRVRDFTDASPRLERMVNRLTLFLTLVGLTALLVGGVGVGNAVRAFLDGKLATVATLKCLGAPGSLIFRTYLLQILILAGGGVLIGLAIGIAAPPLVNALVADLLPIEAEVGIHPWALALAAAFGLLTALSFSLWPLARAPEVPAAGLFRALVSPDKGWPRGGYVAATAVSAMALAGLAVATAQDRMFALAFVGGAALTILAFRAAGWAAVRLARAAGRPKRPGLRLALANLHRPGAPTGSVILSLGLGLTVLVAIVLIEGNMSRQVRESLPEVAPSFFFIDIQPDQIGPFTDLVTGMEGASNLESVPSLRGRIVAINGVPAEQALVEPGESWLLHGDRGVTYAAHPSPGDRIIAGEWWPEDYDGPPLISIYQDIGTAFGIGVGDEITVNILGRDLTATVANLRAIEWETLSINFTMVFSPEPLNGVPHTYLATIHTASPEIDARVQRAVTDAFANVTAVRVRDVLETVNGILRQIGAAVRGTAGITLIAGTLVLAGAIAAGHRRRVYDSVVLKVLGATRADVLRAFSIEYGILGLLTAAIAALVGTVAAWAVLTRIMEIEWVFLPRAVLLTTAICTAITLGCGFIGAWRALSQKAAPLLRTE